MTLWYWTGTTRFWTLLTDNLWSWLTRVKIFTAAKVVHQPFDKTPECWNLLNSRQSFAMSFSTVICYKKVFKIYNKATKQCNILWKLMNVAKDLSIYPLSQFCLTHLWRCWTQFVRCLHIRYKPALLLLAPYLLLPVRTDQAYYLRSFLSEAEARSYMSWTHKRTLRLTRKK